MKPNIITSLRCLRPFLATHFCWIWMWKNQRKMPCPQHSNINGKKKTEHFWFQGLSLHHHAISIKFLRMGLPRACPGNQRAPPVDTEKTSEPIIGSLFGRCNKHTHASYAGKQPPHLLPYLTKRYVKNKMQPTNPNAHTYDNEPWKSQACNTGSHSMSRKYLKTTNTHTTQHTAKGCSRSA